MILKMDPFFQSHLVRETWLQAVEEKKFSPKEKQNKSVPIHSGKQFF